MKKESKKLPSVARVRLVYNTKIPSTKREHIIRSKDAYGVFMAHWDTGTIELFEEFRILVLDSRNHVLGMSQVSRGGTTRTVVDAKMIFQVALLCNANGFILCYNHPSGHLKPSEADLVLTRKLSRGSKLLDMALLDHLIISKEGFYSFADNGQL